MSVPLSFACGPRRLGSRRRSFCGVALSKCSIGLTISFKKLRIIRCKRIPSFIGVSHDSIFVAGRGVGASSTCAPAARPRPLGSDVYAKGASVTVTKKIKLIHEGRFAAQVEIDLINDETGWAPYLSVADARKLDAVRLALKAGRVAEVAAIARVCELQPVSHCESA